MNACSHRSYGQKNRPIFIKMFDDRLIVESPGGFPPFVTPENIYEQHHPRNPRLMDALHCLAFVKMANEGTRRMRDAMREMNLPLPIFEQKEVTGSYSVRVTLKNNTKQRRALVDSDIGKFLSASIVAELTDNERRVLNYLSENGTINISAAQRILPVKTWHAARTILLRLTNKEILFRVHERERDPNSHFVLHPKWSPKKA